MLDTPEAKKIFKACTRFLTHDYPKAPRQVLSELAEMADPELEADRYGQGEVINNMFEMTVGEATLDLSDKEIVELFQMLLTRKMLRYIKEEFSI